MKIDRLIGIIMILLDKKRIGARELANMFEVSPRTIYRDVDTISMAGIPVRSTPGAGGGFEIMQEYKIDKNVFSAADLSALLAGLSGLPNMISGNELANTLAKVKSFIPADSAKDIELQANRIFIDLSPWMGNGNIEPYLETIKSAMRESKLLSFDYADRYGNKTARSAEPYRLVLKSNHWYFQAYCRQRHDFRLFRLSRIANLQVAKETFVPRDYPKPQLVFSDTLSAMLKNIKIRIHRSIMDRVLNHCAFDHFSPDGSEHYIVGFPFIENDYYYNILCGFGDKCECLEPLHVRAEMKRRIQNMATLYEK